MLCEKNKNNVNFLRIVVILRKLRDCGLITTVEYKRAKDYYEKVTGADMIICD